MWITRKTFEDTRLDLAKHHEECRVLAAQNHVLQVNLDWLRTRVNQLEMERAQLLWNYIGVKVPVPEIQRVQDPQDPVHPLNELPSFADVGDKEAARLGIGWDAEGRVAYSK